MPQSRRQLLAAVGAVGALTVAGCATGDGGGTTTTTATTAMGSPTIQVGSHDALGDILVDGEGRTLYMFDQDTQGDGASSCYDNCATAWPPLTVDGSPTVGDGVTAAVTTFERDGGATQVAANGWPLYYYSTDESPGDATGQGVGDAWWVVGPDGTPRRETDTTTTTTTAMDTTEVAVRSDDELGDILVDGDGMTLYMFDQDTQGSANSSCTGGCAEAWPPLTTDGDVETSAGVTASITTFERADGTTQVAANGWPLYGYAQDEAPGDTTGHGVGNVWWTLAPDGTPRRSANSTTTTTTTDGGGIY